MPTYAEGEAAARNPTSYAEFSSSQIPLELSKPHENTIFTSSVRIYCSAPSKSLIAPFLEAYLRRIAGSAAVFGRFEIRRYRDFEQR